ncbi:MAG: peptide deformylase [Desulfobacterales bacterium]
MAILEILTFPDPLLRKKAKPVDTIDGEIQTIIDDMAQTMYDAPGTGLAAIQVGIDKAIVVYSYSPDEETRLFQVLINPKIITREDELISENEGCLSVPDFRADVKRSASVCVEALDREGNPLRIEDQGFLAVILQHEIDHLEGVLFIDRISALKRQMYKSRIKKQHKSK